VCSASVKSGITAENLLARLELADSQKSVQLEVGARDRFASLNAACLALQTVCLNFAASNVRLLASKLSADDFSRVLKRTMEQLATQCTDAGQSGLGLI
jgi:hypothetical protein